MSERRGMVLTAVLSAGLAVTGSLLGSRYVDSSFAMMAVLQSFVPATALGVTALLIVAVVARRWLAAVVAGLLMFVCATLAVPWVVADTVPPSREDLVVMSANLTVGGADAQSLVTAAREHQVDVLVLLGVTSAAVGRLRHAGLDALLAESVGRSSRDGADGTIIRSRIPLTLLEPGLVHAFPHAFDEPVVSIHSPDGDIVLRAVHVLPPSPGEAAGWRSGLADLQTWREGQPAGRPVIMAGDFNSSQSHPGFRQVADTMTDAHRAAGQGWVRTWPQRRRLILPFIQLDHVLVRGLDVVEAGVVHLPGTDHAAVWARLSPHRS